MGSRRAPNLFNQHEQNQLQPPLPAQGFNWDGPQRRLIQCPCHQVSLMVHRGMHCQVRQASVVPLQALVLPSLKPITGGQAGQLIWSSTVDLMAQLVTLTLEQLSAWQAKLSVRRGSGEGRLSNVV